MFRIPTITVLAAFGLSPAPGAMACPMTVADPGRILPQCPIAAPVMTSRPKTACGAGRVANRSPRREGDTPGSFAEHGAEHDATRQFVMME